MAAYSPPRRYSSTNTTITINSAATALSAAASATTSGTFNPFHGPTNLTAQYGLSYEQAHYWSGILCDPTEDGSQDSNHAANSWFGRGCYDPTTKRVTWASTGAGNMSGPSADPTHQRYGYPFNTQPFYDETLDRWTVSRGWKAANQGSDAVPVGHGYDTNCISVTNRRLYKSDLQGNIHVFNLDTNAWLDYIAGQQVSSGLEGNDSPAGMDYIPGRNELWRLTYRRGDFLNCMNVYNLTTGTWSRFLDASSFGATTAGSGGCLSYNPRAYGGAGGVMMGEIGCWTATISATPTVTSVGLPVSGVAMAMEFNAHLCKDPAGDGWFWARSNRDLWRYTFAGGWSLVGTLPSGLDTAAYTMVPIDEYGVIWFVGHVTGSNRAWLYKP